MYTSFRRAVQMVRKTAGSGFRLLYEVASHLCFCPFGVDDAYGRRLNVMVLFHNQVTREQGLFSLRMNHPSFGLYLIAENLTTPTAVLDFPTLERFTAEVRKKYDYIGISSIVANIGKVKKMTEIIKAESPSTKIILGGHCTNIEELENLVEFDYVSRGEGIVWFRKLLGEDTNRPIHHPALLSTLQRRVMGIPLPDQSGRAHSRVGLRQRLFVLRHLASLRQVLHRLSKQRQRGFRHTRADRTHFALR